MSDVFQTQRVRVGKQIRKARLTAGLSHDKLAKLVGTSRQHLIKLEKGQHAPRPEMLAKIGDATGKPDGFFVADDDDEESDAVAVLMRGLQLMVRAAVREEKVA